MSPEFIQKWENLLQDVDKQKVPIEFIKKLILKLQGKRQRTHNDTFSRACLTSYHNHSFVKGNLKLSDNCIILNI